MIKMNDDGIFSFKGLSDGIKNKLMELMFFGVL